eukprot:13711115-Alexandrium_andersonii.AAC.1
MRTAGPCSTQLAGQSAQLASPPATPHPAASPALSSSAGRGGRTERSAESEGAPASREAAP